MVASEITLCFGACVRRLRRRLGISQEALAERANLHRTYITEIECGGRNVTLKSIDRLARALQVSSAILLAQADGPTGPTETSNDASSCVDILMVEDNRQHVEPTLQAFKQARITNPVQVVHDGQEALDFLFCAGRFARRKMDDRPQLVLLDLNLPKIGGLEVLRRIKADERTLSIPVVVLTVSQDSRELAECLRLGAETYITKPVDFQSFSHATSRIHLNWTLLKPAVATAYATGASASA